MAVTTPDSIAYPDGSETTAWKTLMAAMATSVQAALSKKPYKWADAAARTAQAGMSEGDIGDQADTDQQWRYSGSSWVNVSAGNAFMASGALSAVSSFSIDGLTGFDEYEITLDLPTSSAANQLSVVQLRASGVADTSANYDLQRDIAATATASASNTLAGTSWSLANGDRTDKYIVIRLSSLNAARRTVALAESAIWDATANPSRIDFALRHRTASAFDGIGFTVSTGTVTGTYSVRGIRGS